jgi:hypothetical protein
MDVVLYMHNEQIICRLLVASALASYIVVALSTRHDVESLATDSQLNLLHWWIQ